jgi:hypothetical protein
VIEAHGFNLGVVGLSEHELADRGGEWANRIDPEAGGATLAAFLRQGRCGTVPQGPPCQAGAEYAVVSVDSLRSKCENPSDGFVARVSAPLTGDLFRWWRIQSTRSQTSQYGPLRWQRAAPDAKLHCRIDSGVLRGHFRRWLANRHEHSSMTALTRCAWRVRGQVRTLLVDERQPKEVTFSLAVCRAPLKLLL